MTTTIDGGGDTIQNGNFDREKENTAKIIRKETVDNMEKKLIKINGALSKESIDKTYGIADLKVATKNVSHLVMF